MNDTEKHTRLSRGPARQGYRAEPYGYEDPDKPQGDQTRRKDGFDPYRAQPDEHPNSAHTKDDRAHPPAEYQHYGDKPRAGKRASRPRFQSERDR